MKIILKPSPGENREGYLDPCEEAVIDGHWTSHLNDNNDNDSYFTVKHIYDNAKKYGIDKNKIAIGGNYAAAISLKARNEDVPMVAMEILIYPALAVGDTKVLGYE